jgi:AraC-like DNA-binding protein
VEKAGRMLIETNLSLSEIAGSCGFEDQSWFSKIFKTYTGMSPGKYRSQGGGTIKEISENNVSADYLKIIR